MINLSQELTDADYAHKVTVPTSDITDGLEIPEKIGKYEVCEQLGKGTCGVVHRGFDPFVQRNVAIKIAHMREDTEGSSGSSTQTFFTEAHAAGKLQHPHIVSLFDAGIEGTLNYIVMEYLEGETLEKFTRGVKRIPVDTAIDVIFKCCKALDYSHSQGVVHRDIKPTNIMITKDGDVKIMDFSIALMNANQAPGEQNKGGAVGTPGYMSPEQVLGKDISATSDLYSLAVVMFEMLTGKRLFESKTMRELFVSIIREPAPKLSSVRSDLPTELSQILEKALRKKSADRFQTGQEFAVGLGRVFDKLRLSEKHVTRSENRNMLQNLNFFNGFTDNEIDQILDASHLIQYKQDEVIINEGDVDNAFYIIVVGSAGVHKASVLLDTLREGDCFGEIGFLMQTKRTASIIASSDMLVLKVNALLMDQVAMETQLHYYKAFVETLVYRLSVTSARLSALRASNEAAKVQTATRSVAESEDSTQPLIHETTQPIIRQGEDPAQAENPDTVPDESRPPKQTGATP
jgi:serine/threonine-protein kinase